MMMKPSPLGAHLDAPLRLNRRSLLILTAGFAARTQSTANAQPAFPGNGDPPLVVDPAWLQSQAGPTVRVLDCSPLRTYQDAHIPGAVHTWWQDTIDPNKPAYGGLLRPGGQQPDGSFDQTPRIQLLEDLGIDDQTFVVAYDDDQGRWAAHMVWFMRFLGHNRAAMLEGNLAAWRDAGGDTESRTIEPPDLDPPAITPGEGFYVETEEFERLLAESNTLLVDVRNDAELHDDLNGNLPLGRIPGATSLPWDSVCADDDGRLVGPDVLSAQLANLGITLDRQVVLYARFGVEASHTWLALKLAGFPNVTTFDGGWAGWAADPEHPLESL
jgi:thiosulfate/3-mercaptopyruvate sulfurtransferase